MNSADSPVWFITGCSSGLGRELARAVLEHGWRAVVTARDPGKAADVIAGHEERAIVLTLDVTDAEQIAHAVAQAQAAFGQIDVLVNNAGYGTSPPSRRARTTRFAPCSTPTSSAWSTPPGPPCPACEPVAPATS
nr:SDR family NAD(P)-dependent oxidoreductase [Streptomyces sp. TLI_146]